MNQKIVILLLLSSSFFWVAVRTAPFDDASTTNDDISIVDENEVSSPKADFCFERGVLKQATEICAYWQSMVDPTVKNPGLHNVKDKPENILAAIKCLLALKGKKNEAKIHGATNPYVSDIFLEPCTVEVAALFYATYLFYGRWDYVMAIVLVDTKAGLFAYNTQYAIDRAYELYNIWYEEILKIGLEKAREIKLDPLKNSEIQWY